MTTRFIRVHGARFTRKWLFEYLRNTRVTRQKVTYCRRRTMCNFLSALVAFLPSPSSSYHHGSVACDPPRDYAQKYEHAPFRSHVSRDLLIPQTLTRICGRTISRVLYTCLLFNYHPFFRGHSLCYLYFHIFFLLWNNSKLIFIKYILIIFRYFIHI